MSTSRHYRKKHEHINQTNKTTEKLEKQNTIRKEGACTRQPYSPIGRENQTNQQTKDVLLCLSFFPEFIPQKQKLLKKNLYLLASCEKAPVAP